MKPPISDPWPVEMNSLDNNAPPAPVRTQKWGCFMIGLWIYSTVVMFIVAISIFIPKASTSSSSSGDYLAGLILLAPIILFLILAGVHNFRK